MSCMGSLRLRLLLGTLLWMLLALGIAGWGLRALFAEHVTRQLQAQLVTQLDRLSAAVDWERTAATRPARAASRSGRRERRRSGHIRMGSMMGDPRLEQPLSGLYWQVDALDDDWHAGLARSRSLWDQVLQLPAVDAAQAGRGDRAVNFDDERGQAMLAMVRVVQPAQDDAPLLRLIAAADRSLLAEPLQRFTRLLWAALALLALGLVLAIVVQLQLALRPLKRLRAGLAAVRSGRAQKLQGHYPQELQPLVAEFNHVFAENADMVQRARTQAGNLAHAVHTPLAVLDNAAASGEPELPRLVREQVARARRQVDTHLARARAAAAVRATGLATPVLPVVRALLRTMRRLHAPRDLAFALADCAQDLAFRGEEQDLYELLGNLIDNAGKWARTCVRVDVQHAGTQLQLSVDDDGPGIAAEERARMFQRGVQLDERRPGSGLGLDIVRELVETYGGSVQVEKSRLGGARLILLLPQAWPDS